ncbi:MAG TPA: VCBS repeat-containing protein [Planctomycetota bacterium]|nr:VCBS repeat-containing protein [Planctomycetota bacterium]
MNICRIESILGTALLAFALGAPTCAADEAPAAQPAAPRVSPAFAIPAHAEPITPAVPSAKPADPSAVPAITYAPNNLFAAPVALVDAQDKPIVTGKALGCPFAADFNSDGKIDVILGAHESMKTPFGGIWLIPNVGTNAEPKFDWAKAWRAAEKDMPVKVGCGCQEAGDTFVQSCDWNDDGFMDLAVSDSYAEAYVLVNDGKSKDQPTYTRQPFFKMEKVNHGMMAGGGDWNQDGVRDFLHMSFAGEVFKVLPGKTQANGGLQFESGGLKACTVAKVSGKALTERAYSSAWAWDYSGTAKARGVIEYVGMGGEKKNEITLFEVKEGQSRKVTVLATSDAMFPQCTASDLNGDGKPDILFSGGDYDTEKAKTKIFVMLAKADKK